MAASESQLPKRGFIKTENEDNGGLIVSVLEFDAAMIFDEDTDKNSDEYDNMVVELLTQNEYDFICVQNVVTKKRIMESMTLKGYSSISVKEDNTIKIIFDTYNENRYFTYSFVIFWNRSKFDIQYYRNKRFDLLIKNKRDVFGIVGFFNHKETNKKFCVSSIDYIQYCDDVQKMASLAKYFKDYIEDKDLFIIVCAKCGEETYDDVHIGSLEWFLFDRICTNIVDYWGAMIWCGTNNDCSVYALLEKTPVDITFSPLKELLAAKIQLKP